MKRILRVLSFIAALLVLNNTNLPMALQGGWMFFSFVAVWIVAGILGRRPKSETRRLTVMMRGYDLILDALILLFAEALILLAGKFLLGWFVGDRSHFLWIEAVITAVFVVLLLLAGMLSLLPTSKRLGALWRLLMLMLWWVPVFNVFLFVVVLRRVRLEHHLAVTHALTMETYAENQDCATRYPILLVHGIFFRDWQLISYWGRIPRELTRCGARLFYGGQQSAAPVAESAEELVTSIHRVITETGAEKVNIIAHSKGGLDSRYAISRLGCAHHVASLTTINTPHRGCVWARTMLEKMPEKTVNFIAEKYNRLFHRLGDKHPDFLGGVRELTDTAARQFNAETPDSAEVYYQSVMSVMDKKSAAPFPLNICSRLVTKYDRELNDGLVAGSSAPWGSFLGEIKVRGKRGISHGDIIDLFREDIVGFDVAAYYAGLVRGLKQRGF